MLGTDLRGLSGDRHPGARGLLDGQDLAHEGHVHVLVGLDPVGGDHVIFHINALGQCYGFVCKGIYHGSVILLVNVLCTLALGNQGKQILPDFQGLVQCFVVVLHARVHACAGQGAQPVGHGDHLVIVRHLLAGEDLCERIRVP